jgi:hypothetical protein
MFAEKILFDKEVDVNLANKLERFSLASIFSQSNILEEVRKSMNRVEYSKVLHIGWLWPQWQMLG